MPTDERIKEEILEVLLWDSRVDASNVTVEVHDGEVRLAGRVESYTERQTAEEAAWSVPGTISVDNGITVQTLVRGTSDQRIQSDVENVLERLTSIPKSRFRVSAVSGWVTLYSEVESFSQKVRAEELASLVSGVTGVTNELTVVPTRRAEDREIGRAVTRAMERKPEIPADSVHVEVEGQKVFLFGSVPTRDARSTVYEIAANTAGVRDIENHVTVSPQR